MAALLYALFGRFTIGLQRIDDPPRAVAVTTSGAWSSMIYLARTDSGVIVIDLGWVGAEGALERGLAELGATPADVVAVFLTHSHRDHIAGWSVLPRARFHIARPEADLLFGRAAHAGWLPRLADRLRAPRLPRPDELRLVPFDADTSFAFGADSVRAFPIYGHTAGSAAYVVRGTLFAGDAVNYRPIYGWRGARAEMSEDVARSRLSLQALWPRLARHSVRTVCTAHGKCGPFDAAMRERVGR